jgi:hypothetical protein
VFGLVEDLFSFVDGSRHSYGGWQQLHKLDKASTDALATRAKRQRWSPRPWNPRSWRACAAVGSELIGMGSTSDVGTLLNNFVAELGRETRLLQQVVTLRTRATDHDSRTRITPLVNEVDAAVSRLEAKVEILRSYAKVRAAAIAEDTRKAEAHLQATRARISAIRQHLPDELLHVLRRKEADASAKTLAESRPPLAPVLNDAEQNISAPTPQGTSSTFQRALTTGRDKTAAAATMGRLEADTRRNENLSAVAPRPRNEHRPGYRQNEATAEETQTDSGELSVRDVTQEELSNAPSYVRGRLTVERTHTVVTALNNVLQKKYEFLTQDIRNLSSDEVTRRHEIQAVEAECGEIAGRSFFTDADCKLEGVRFDSITKSVVNLLRHVSILKEVRGKNKVRVFIVVDA